MNIDTSLNLLTGLNVVLGDRCPKCGDEDSQHGETGTISDEVASDVSEQPSGK